MTNIKVTVEYEVPKTNKFDALLAEYAVAKKLADETVSHYKPLADLAEVAKMDAILKQLEPIKYYAKQIALLKEDRNPVVIDCCFYGEYVNRQFSVSYFPNTSSFDIRWFGNIFSKDRLVANRLIFCQGDNNILGNWDKWRVYNQLEKCAEKKLETLISKQKTRMQEQIDRLNNIQGGM